MGTLVLFWSVVMYEKVGTNYCTVMVQLYKAFNMSGEENIFLGYFLPFDVTFYILIYFFTRKI